MPKMIGAARKGGDPTPFPVPDAVDMRQACLKLQAEGRLQDVETYVATQDALVQIEWTRAKELRRDHPLVGIMGFFWGMTTEDMDEWFRDAKAIGPTLSV